MMIGNRIMVRCTRVSFAQQHHYTVIIQTAPWSEAEEDPAIICSCGPSLGS